MVKHILEKIKTKIKNKNVKIIYIEPDDDRILSGANEVFKQKLGLPILIGNIEETKARMKKLKINSDKFQIIEPAKSEKFNEYTKRLYEMRKEKGLSKEEAEKLMKMPPYFGAMMLHSDDADCLIGGARYTTAETLKPAFQIIKTHSKTKIASSFFLMLLRNKKEKAYVFSDCSFVRNPTSEELSEIAISTADSAEKFGIKPRVALLSYSTKGSGFGESVDIVRKATELARNKRPDLIIDGELQLDAAIIPSVAKIKCPDSPLKGEANVLIFPDLNSGNIGYKLVERLAGASALGPISQGLNKTIDILSRGCSVSDVINVSAITIMRALEMAHEIKHFKSEKHLLSRGKK